MDVDGNLTAIGSDGSIVPDGAVRLRTYLASLRKSEREALLAVIVQSGVQDYLLGPEGNYSVAVN